VDAERTTALIDSPGFQEFGLHHIDPMQLAGLMRDLKPHVGHCKFYNCTHLHEPGCAVIAAVAHADAEHPVTSAPLPHLRRPVRGTEPAVTAALIASWWREHGCTSARATRRSLEGPDCGSCHEARTGTRENRIRTHNAQPPARCWWTSAVVRPCRMMAAFEQAAQEPACSW
jgi:hypothetical protein